MASEHVMEVSDSEFDVKVVASDAPVIADFWATWCVPCRKVGPILEELAAEYEGKVKVAKINVDENTGVAGKLGIRSIPTLLFYKGGEVVDTVVGAASKREISEKIQKMIA